MTKAELRKAYFEKRNALTAQQIQQMSEQLCKTFFLYVNVSSVKVLHTYLPIEKNKEPDTSCIINRIRKEYPSIQLSVPKVNAESGLLENYFWNGRDSLMPNKWGIPEPVGGMPTPVQTIDMVLVPLLVFDSAGHRVGYGKGFYDQFLASCRMNCKKIGLSFFPPPEATIAKDSHDQKLDQVITPEKLFVF